MPLDGVVPIEVAKPPGVTEAGLAYVHDGDPGIGRRRMKTGFRYVDEQGRPVRDPEVLERIRKLAIPPAYQDVWICSDPLGHVQATGRDAKGRKQYRYHPRWRATRDESKFSRMAAFGRALPIIRERVDADLRKRDLSHDKVVATVVKLLETTLIRVGNDEYAKANKSFGLTTLRSRHVKADGPALVFEFRGKSGVQHRTGLRDRRLVRIIKALQELPGQRLFQYVDDSGARRQIGSADVNAYLREITGEGFSAKDFRTWAGTMAAAKALALQPEPKSDHETKRLTTLCIKATAGLLGNTPAVCRAAYIHPAVIDAFAGRTLPAHFAELDGEALEKALLIFLEALVAEVPLSGQDAAAGPTPDHASGRTLASRSH